MNALAVSQEEEQLVLLLASFPRSSAQVLMAKLNPSISQPTFSRRIEAMERRGIVKREGRGRSTVYSLVDPQWYLNLPVQKRTPTTYRFEWLENFAPHQHRFLAAEEDQRLHELGVVPGISPNLFFQRVYERFLIDLSYASSKMEGNTYTLLDTEKLLKEGSAAEGKAAEEATMILNHKEAIVYLVENLAELSVSERHVKNLHALLSRDLVREGEPGRLRTRLVNITNTAYSPLAVPQQIDEQFRLLVQKANEIASPFEQSIFLLVGLSCLQPFIDVNKRTARLAANIPLFKAGLCPLSYRHMDNARYMGGLLLFYETLNADGITAAFVDGYEKSSSVLKSHYEEHRRKPDRVDLAYRRGTNQVIREVILYGKSADDRERIVARWLATAPEEDRDQLLERINAKLEHIGTDEAALYGVTPEDIGEFLRGAAPAPMTRTTKTHRPPLMRSVCHVGAKREGVGALECTGARRGAADCTERGASRLQRASLPAAQSGSFASLFAESIKVLRSAAWRMTFPVEGPLPPSDAEGPGRTALRAGGEPINSVS